MINVRKYGIFLVVILFMIAMISFVLAHDSGQTTDGEESQITNAPEFPSTLLPVIIIIGFLGVVVMIKMIKEHEF
jgi:hypothetical protein